MRPRCYNSYKIGRQRSSGERITDISYHVCLCISTIRYELSFGRTFQGGAKNGRHYKRRANPEDILASLIAKHASLQDRQRRSGRRDTRFEDDFVQPDAQASDFTFSEPQLSVSRPPFHPGGHSVAHQAAGPQGLLRTINKGVGQDAGFTSCPARGVSKYPVL